MGKVRLIVAIVVIILLFAFALLNSRGAHSTADIQFYLKAWTVYDVPVWGIIFITLAIGLVLGYILRGGRKKKKEHT
jgi:uncharacterized integral membrane protein